MGSEGIATSFLLYINDLPNYIPDVQMVLYADDINILIVDKEEDKVKDKNNSPNELLRELV
jgi:hypothetical protein